MSYWSGAFSPTGKHNLEYFLLCLLSLATDSSTLRGGPVYLNLSRQSSVDNDDLIRSIISTQIRRIVQKRRFPSDNLSSLLDITSQHSMILIYKDDNDNSDNDNNDNTIT